MNNRSRFVELSGAYNFRDLGGLPTAAGSVRVGRLYRSDSLHFLHRNDVDRLLGLGIVTVVDLRSEHEVATHGRGLIADEAIGWFHAPLSDYGAPHYTRSEALDAGDLGRHYVEILEERTEMLVRALTHLASSDHLPAVFHSAVGKDRTGVLAALVLGCIGVANDVIVADYTLSDDNMPVLMARLRGIEPGEVEMTAVARAEQHTMEGFLTELERRYGGARGWARDAGVDDDVVDRLHELLVEPGPAQG